MKRIFSVLLPLLLLARFAGAQSQSIQLSLVLSPPYSPYFSDYLSFGNKALLTVINTDAGATEVYFKGSITGNTGVSGATAGDFKPAVPISLKSGVSQLRGGDFEEYFSLQHFDLKGTTAGELTLGAGLPEGAYTICLQAFDFNTNAPRSNNACVTVNIVYPEPPVLQLPLCDNGNVLGNKAQNVPFSWTIPPGAPPGTRYVMKMAQLYPGQNANDAMQGITTPPFFETEIPINTYIYRLSDPPLVPGAQYAWQVQAFDPNKLTAFKNNGFSPVCYFTYSVLDLSPIASFKVPLSIYSPVCLSGSGSKGKYFKAQNTNKEALKALDQKLLYSSEQGASIDWRWNTQQDSASIFTPLTSINGGDSLSYEVRIEPLQLMGDAKTAVGAVKDKSYVGMVTAPRQQLRMSAEEIEAAGLKTGHWYKATVVATGSKAGLPLNAGTVTSCDFQLLRVGDSVRTTVISGQLAYRLEEGASPHPAGGVSITVGFTGLTKHTPKTYQIPGKTGGSAPQYRGLETTTDADGKFSVALPLEASAEAMKYIDLTVNNPYYRQPDSTYAIDIKAYDSSITKVVNGKTVTEAVANGFKKSLNIGQRLVEAYTYDLTVKLSKGFPKFGFDSTKGYRAIDNTFDSLSINPNIKVKSGIPVMIYRLVKNTLAPRWEGDTVVPALEVAQPYKRLVVGRGTTGYQTIGGKEQTVVVFKRLLCSQSASDVYYVQALLPQKATAGGQSNRSPFGGGSASAGGLGGSVNPNYVSDWKNGYTEPPPSDYAIAKSQQDEDDFLAAPEQLVRFDIKKLKLGRIHDTMSIGYNLISSKPPLSRLKGQLVYSWPSSPGVVRPLPNTKFSIKTAYLINGQKDAWKTAKSKCQKVLQKLRLAPGAAGKGGPMLDPGSGDVVMGAGQTDDQGYFDILVLNYDKKGRLTDSGVFEAMYMNACPPVGNESPLGGKGLETDPILISPKDKAGWVQGGLTVNQIKEVIGMGFNSQYINGTGQSYNNMGNLTSNHTNSLLNGAGTTIAGTKGGLFGNTIGSNFGGAAGLGNKAGTLKSGKMNKGGPAEPLDDADPGVNDKTLVAGQQNVSVDRVLVMQIFTPWHAQPDRDIVVNAFETADLGKIPVTVNEADHTLTLKTTPAGKVPTLERARVVVYREPGEKPDALPQGEGTPKHPQKDLIGESMSSGTASGPKEWILETGLSTDANVASYKAMALLANTAGAKYYTQITPAPDGNATRFKQQLVEGLPGTATLKLLPGKIAGRVAEYAKPYPGIGGAKITITKFIFFSVTLYADKDGYFEYENGQSVGGKQLTWADDGTSSLILKVEKTGYATVSKEIKGPAFGIQQLQQILLPPGAYIKFKTVGEQSAQIAGYALRGTDTNAYMAKYDGGKYFRLPAPSNAAVKIKIIPEDPGYFDTTFTVNTKNGELNLGDVKMVRRAHRMRFKIKRLDGNGNEIPANLYTDDGFQISINNGEQTGKVFPGKFCHFTFENVSVNNYALVLTDLNKRGYIPVALNLSNKESRDFTDYTLTIKKGGVISGVVTLDGTPVKGARVYIEQSGSGNGETGFDAMTTLSGDGGAYVLNGVPISNNEIIIHAAMEDPSKTIIGDAKTGSLGSFTLTLNMALTSSKDADLRTIWGYPITLEKLKKDGDEFVATGLINVSGGSRFKNLAGNGNMRFKDVRFIKRFNVAKPPLDPKENAFDLVEAGVKMRYANRYNVALESTEGSAFKKQNSTGLDGKSTVLFTSVPRPFKVEKGADSYGMITARVRIVDNSYNYPSTYLNFEGTDDFWIGKDAAGGTITNAIPALPAKTQAAWTPRLSDKNGQPLRYNFIGFKATADPAKSYIAEDGKIHLNTTFRGRVPGSDSIDINLPDLVLDGNKIEPYKGGNALMMQLESWKVEVKDWTVDPVKGGLFSNNVVIHTGVADLKMKTFNLRKDLFVMDDFDATNINLGAVTLENTAPGASVIYDQKVGSDAKPHWRFNIVGQGTQPAGSFYLDDAKQQRLDVEYMQLISYNNENLITLRKLLNPLHVLGNSRINFYPQSVSSEKSLLFLDGPGKFDVPRTPEVNIRIAYKKEGGKLVENAEPMKEFSFTGKGNVVFTVKPNSQPVKGDKLLTYTGTVVEPGKFEPLDCEFSFGNNDPGTIKFTGTKPMNLVGGTQLKLGAQKRDNLLRNGMLVADKDWTTLRFSGELLDPSKVMQPGNIVDFEVLGEIKADAKSIKASDINTPFGNLNMVFDFPSKQMTGAMHMDDVEFGSYKFTGDVEVQFGAQGFLTMAAGQLNTGVLLAEGFGTFSSGLVLGAKSLAGADGPSIIQRTTQFSKSPKANCWLTDHAASFKGFYFTGGYDILNVQKGVDLEIAACYFSAVLGIEASLGASIGNAVETKVGLGAHGIVKAGMSAITGTSISGQLEAHLGVDAKVALPAASFDVDGFADLTFGFRIKQELLVTTLEFDFTRTAGANFYISNNRAPKANYDFFLSAVNENATCK